MKNLLRLMAVLLATYVLLKTLGASTYLALSITSMVMFFGAEAVPNTIMRAKNVIINNFTDN